MAKGTEKTTSVLEMVDALTNKASEGGNGGKVVVDESTALDMGLGAPRKKVGAVDLTEVKSHVEKVTENLGAVINKKLASQQESLDQLVNSVAQLVVLVKGLASGTAPVTKEVKSTKKEAATEAPAKEEVKPVAKPEIATLEGVAIDNATLIKTCVKILQWADKNGYDLVDFNSEAGGLIKSLRRQEKIEVTDINMLRDLLKADPRVTYLAEDDAFTIKTEE